MNLACQRTPICNSETYFPEWSENDVLVTHKYNLFPWCSLSCILRIISHFGRLLFFITIGNCLGTRRLLDHKSPSMLGVSMELSASLHKIENSFLKLRFASLKKNLTHMLWPDRNGIYVCIYLEPRMLF